MGGSVWWEGTGRNWAVLGKLKRFGMGKKKCVDRGLLWDVEHPEVPTGRQVAVEGEAVLGENRGAHSIWGATGRDWIKEKT